MKKLWIILLILLACAAAGIGVYWYLTKTTTQEEPSPSVTPEETTIEAEEVVVEEEMVVMEEEVVDITDETNGLIVFEDITFDTLMLGKWQHVIDTGWYRVYTMEPAGDDYYWGHEWNTSDDIFEEDLNPYGNGWFKWKKEGDNVTELHMTDNQSASIPYQYQMQRLNNQEMRYKETADNERQVFSKCPEW